MTLNQEMLEAARGINLAARHIITLYNFGISRCDTQNQQDHCLEMIEEKAQLVKTSSGKIAKFLEFGG